MAISRFSQLPDEVRELAEQLIVCPRTTQKAALEAVNAELAERGEEGLSRSGFNRAAKSMEDAGRELRESLEVSKMWSSQIGALPAGEMGRFITQFIQTLAFKQLRSAQTGDVEISITDLNQLALLAQRAETATTLNVKREAELRQAIALEEKAKAAETAGAAAKRLGWTKEQAKGLIDAVLEGNVA